MKRIFFALLCCIHCQLSFSQWTPVNSGTTSDIHDIQFLDPLNGFHCGVNGIYKTADGGNTWNKIRFTAIDSPYLNGIIFEDIHFLDANTGVAAGEVAWDLTEIIIRTTNGGATWSIVHTGPGVTTPGDYYRINELDFRQAPLAFAVGEKGRILKSTNSGASWTLAYTYNSTTPLHALVTRSSSAVFAGGTNVRLTSTNGGTSWTTTALTNQTLSTGFFLSTLYGYLAGNVFYKYNYSNNMLSQVTTNSPYSFADIHFTSVDTGYACTGMEFILQTTDSGTTWERTKLSGRLNTITFVNTNLGFVAGDAGVMYKTTNHGGQYAPIIPQFTAPTTYCADSTVSFTNHGSQNYTYTWKFNGQTFATSYNATLTLPDTAEGVYPIQLIGYNGALYDTVSKNITVLSVSNISLNAVGDSTCSGQSASLRVLNSQSGTSYRLYKNGATVGNAQNGNNNTLTFSPGTHTVDTDYYIIATRTNACGSLKDTAYIKVHIANPNLTLNVGATKTSMCRGDSTSVFVQNTELDVTYQLRNSSNQNVGTAKQGTGGTLYWHFPTNNSSVTYNVRATNQFGCAAQLLETQLVRVRSISMNMAPAAFNYYTQEPVTFTNTSNADSYIWRFDSSASVTSDTAKFPTITYSSVGNKLITLVGNMVEGCTDSAKAIISIFNPASPDAGSACTNDSIGFSGVQVYNTTTNSSGNIIVTSHIDNEGNVYLVGYSGGLYPRGFLKKYDKHSNLLWTKVPDPCGTCHSGFSSIATDQDGNVYVTGSYSRQFKMDTINVSTSRKQFVAFKLDSSGTARWVIHTNYNESGSTENNQVGGTDILYADDDHIYVMVVGRSLGHPENPIAFSDTTVSGFTQNWANAGGMLHINAKGEYLGADFFRGYVENTYPTNGPAVIGISPRLKMSWDGDVYLFGRISNTVPGIITMGNISQLGGVVIAVLDTITDKWAKVFTTEAGVIPLDFVLDHEKNIYGVGSATMHDPWPSSETFYRVGVTKVDSTGNLLWTNYSSIFYNNNGSSLQCNIALSNDMDEVFIFGQHTTNGPFGFYAQNGTLGAVSGNTQRDIVISSFSDDGNLNWIKTLGTGTQNYAVSMKKAPCDNNLNCVYTQYTGSNIATRFFKYDADGGCTPDDCSVTLPSVQISGVTRTPSGTPVHGVVVHAIGSYPIRVALGGQNGAYSVAVDSGAAYRVIPMKNNDGYAQNGITNNGVTILDVLLMRRHILGIPLTTPYQIIAADINRSGTVTGMDVLLVRKLILQSSPEPYHRLWGFVPHNYVFSNPANPFPHDTARYYANATALSGQDYIAVKLGDVNESWNPLGPKTTHYEGIFYLNINCTEAVQPGEEIIIPVRANGFSDVSGYQFTLNWNTDMLKFEEVINADTDNRFALHKTEEGKLGVLWTQADALGMKLQEDAVLFVLKFVAKSAGSCDITVNSSLIPVEAANGSLELLEIAKLDATTGITAPVLDGYAVFQNVPNPFRGTTTLTFRLPQTEQVSIELFDVIGQRVEARQANFEQGYHTIQAGSARLAPGIYYCRLKAGDFSGSVKMICVE